MTASGALTLSVNGGIGATEAVNAGTFTLANGNWSQDTASLPSFTAQNFVISGGSFLRAAGGGNGSPYQIADVYGLQGIVTRRCSPTSFSPNHQRQRYGELERRRRLCADRQRHHQFHQHVQRQWQQRQQPDHRPNKSKCDDDRPVRHDRFGRHRQESCTEQYQHHRQSERQFIRPIGRLARGRKCWKYQRRRGRRLDQRRSDR